MPSKSPTSSTSSLPPPSYIDTTPSLPRRLAPSHRPLSPTASTSTSTYTGSYIDDALPPTTANFGATTTHSHTTHRKQHDHAPSTVLWNADVAKAVSGDIRRSLARLRSVGAVEVKRGSNGDDVKEKREKKRGVVKVPAPPKWGVFVIRCEGGRVVVVDGEGEFDSGIAGEGGVEEMKKGKRWVRDVRGVDMSPVRGVEEEEMGIFGCGEDVHHSSAPQQLQSKHEEDDDDAVRISRSASPTAFFMTGGLSGWPSRSASPVRSPTIPHEITWATTSPQARLPRTSTISTTSQLSPQSEWPPPSQPSGSTSQPPHQWLGKASKQPIYSSLKAQKGSSNHIPPSPHSRYNSPAFVEVTYDEPPPNEEIAYSPTTWDDEKQTTQHTDDEDRRSGHSIWSRGRGDTKIENPRHASVVSVVGWSASEREASSGDRSMRNRGWSSSLKSNSDNDNDNDNDNSDRESWDGFERRKTSSEVSLVGSSIASRRSQITNRTHRSGRSSRYGYSNWEIGRSGSEAGSWAETRRGRAT